jgi:starvation-inducible outer membrane lipoprotein
MEEDQTSFGSVAMKLAHRFNTLFVMIMLVMLAACSSSPTREGPGEVIDDSLITSKVKAALIADPVVKAREVKVETFKGVVELSGFVDSRDAANRAVEIARGIKGVKDVKNAMVIKTQVQ